MTSLALFFRRLFCHHKWSPWHPDGFRRVRACEKCEKTQYSPSSAPFWG